MMQTFIYEGVEYQITPISTERNLALRGLDIAEVLELLPLAIKTAKTIKTEIIAAKNGQKPAVTVANSMLATVPLVKQIADSADLQPTVMSSLEKGLNYTNGAALLVLNIEQ